MNDLAILIPAYNDGEALIRTLDSISETDTSFTVVIVDDGSREAIVVPTDRYPFAVEVIRQPLNGGIVKALNTGLAHIQEKGFAFVARLDAADLNLPHRFQMQYDRLQADRELFMVGANVVFRDETDDRAIFTTNLPVTYTEIRRWMEFRNCFIHPSVMLRTEVLESVGSYDGSLPHIEDYVWFSRIVKRYRCENIEEPLVDCYVRAGGISVAHQKRQLISGLKYKLAHPQPLNLLWYAYLLKRVCYLVMPFGCRVRLKQLMGFVTAPNEEGKVYGSVLREF